MNDTCVLCNETVPEGRMVCWKCENNISELSRKPDTFLGMMAKKYLRENEKETYMRKKPVDGIQYQILIDVDDVVNNLCEVWCGLLSEKYHLNVSYLDVTEWELYKFFPSLTIEEVYEPLNHSDIWDKVKPKKDAIKYIQKLVDDGFQVYFCTAANYHTIRDKYERFLKTYFPFVPWNHIIVANKKQMIKADFLIDDGIHNLIGGSYTKILMSAPHNKSYDAEINGVFRADDWESAYNYIKHLTNH